MLGEMAVADLSLNELSRRVGLAKSNVIRYFETREAVLLTLLERQARHYLDALRAALEAKVDRSASLDSRTRAVATVVAECFDARPMLCQLLGAQAGVLEHNVSVEIAHRFKRGALDNLLGLAAAVQRPLPELDDDQAAQAARTIVVLAGAIWIQSHPAPTVRAAIESDPSLTVFVVSFHAALASTVTIFLTGLLASRDTPRS